MKKGRDTVLAASLLCVGIFNAAPSSVYASGNPLPQEVKQSQKVTGTVTDGKDPIIGATVKIVGTSTGAITDIDGNFTLDMNSKGKIEISYVGFVTQTVDVTPGVPVNVTLKEDSKAIDEVVVVGYGTVKRSDLTGSVASLDASSLTAASQTNAIDAMQGHIAGVNITRNAARPGGSYNIVIRGKSSINNSNEPLWVIDGIPTNSDASDLNPDDIEKIDVLKDASATAIYGSRGANGVIIVTTKHGKEGRFSISYDGYYGARKASNLPKMMSGDEYVKFRTELFKNMGRSTDRSNSEFFTTDEWARIDSGDYTDWVDLVLRTGQQYSNTVTASGGDKNGTFSFGVGQLHEEGTVRDQDYNRYNMHVSTNRKFKDNWEMGGSLYFTYSKQNEGSYETLRSAYRMPPVAYPYDSEGNLVYHAYRNDAVTNPLLESSKDGEHRENKRYRIFGNIYLQYKPISDLTLKTSFSPQMLYVRKGSIVGKNAKNGMGSNANVGVEYNTSLYWSYVWDNQVTYDHSFDKHHLNASLVQSIQLEQWEGSDQQAKNFPFNSYWYNIGAAGLSNQTASSTNYSKRTLSSVLGRIQYSYNDRYLFTASGRYDGSSRLAKGNKWAFFPSAAAAWRITEEEFMYPTRNWLSNLKLRLSYGVTGNDAVSIYGTQSGVSTLNYDFGGTVVPAYYKNGLANKDLTWEKTYEINAGLDFGFLDNRINGSVDVYRRDAKDLIMKRNIPVTTGWSSIWDNIGWVRNTGVEVTLNTMNIQKKNFGWETNINFTKNNNKIVELYNGKQDDVANSWFIGHPLDVNYDYKFIGIWQTDEASEAAKYGQSPGQVKVQDLNNDGVINASDKQILGQRSPKWIGSITNTFRLYDFDLSVYIYTQQGAQLKDYFMSTYMTLEGNYDQLDVDYWTVDNPTNKYPMPGNKGKYFDCMRYVSTSFWRVGSITLGYNLPKKITSKLHLQKARVYATTNNPFTFTSYKGFDPEWASQNTWGTATGYTTYLIGAKIEL
jgi:TonB-linked SusC/RagA family outer membrane protein